MTKQDQIAKQQAAEAPEGRVYAHALRAQRPAVIAVMACSAILNVLMLAGSIYMLQVYDRALPSGSVPTLLVLFSIIVILYSFLGLFDALRTRLLGRVALRIDHQLAKPSFRHWLQSTVHGHEAREISQVHADVSTLRTFLSSTAILAMLDLLFLPIFLGALFLLHPWLGWVTLAGAGIGLILAWINRLVTNTSIEKAGQLDMVATKFALKGQHEAEAIVAMGMQEHVTGRWNMLHRQALAMGQIGSEPSGGLAAASRAVRLLLQSTILTLAAFLVLRGDLTGGMIFVSSILAGRALGPIDQIIGQWRVIARGLAAHARLKTTYAALPSAASPVDLPAPTGAVTLSNVVLFGAALPGRDPLRILDGITLDLAPGEAVGIIGNSASGKTSLARLLVGAARPDQGEIRIDGATFDQWDPQRLGRSIGYLPQSLELLPGSVRDNIARFDPSATDAEVIEAARLAGVHETILAMPQGYATQLGAPGSPRLSGGQLQRLGLARATFGRPALVVLDEPNSNLDPAGEAALANAIRSLRAQGSCVVVVAHRPDVLTEVSRIVVLSAGKISRIEDRKSIQAARQAEAAASAQPEAQAPVSPQAPMSDQPAAKAPARASAQAVAQTAAPAADRAQKAATAQTSGSSQAVAPPPLAQAAPQTVTVTKVRPQAGAPTQGALIKSTVRRGANPKLRLAKPGTAAAPHERPAAPQPPTEPKPQLRKRSA